MTESWRCITCGETVPDGGTHKKADGFDCPVVRFYPDGRRTWSEGGWEVARGARWESDEPHTPSRWDRVRDVLRSLRMVWP